MNLTIYNFFILFIFTGPVFCSLVEIPQFILDHSPMIYLYSEEKYYPGDIASYIPKFELCLPEKHYSNVPNLVEDLNKLAATIPPEICFDGKLDIHSLKPIYEAFLSRDHLASGVPKFEFTKEQNLRNKKNHNFDANDVIPEMIQYQVSSNLLVMTRHSIDPHASFLKGFRPNNMGRAPKTPATLLVRYHHVEEQPQEGLNKTFREEEKKDIEFIDAYWGLFYPFNEGAYVMGTGPWGNHLGDWEHIMIRFKRDEKNGFSASEIWLSAHSGGFAYDFNKITKYDSNLSPSASKPLVFSAKGTHANYASVGQHAHDVPFFFSALSDFTDRGLLWDVGSNYYGYSFHSYDSNNKNKNGFYQSKKNDIISVSDSNSEINFLPSGKRELDLGTSWLNYRGRWGNAKLAKDHPLQKNGYVQWRYIDGPTGPIGKNLNRERICQKDYVANNFIYWNWFHLGSKCRIRRTIKKGAGLDAERGEFVGDNCGSLLYTIKPAFIRRFLELVTWRGLLCYTMEFFTG